MQARLAVFDCDGTLVDTEAGIVRAMERAFATRGLTAPDPMRVRRVVGLSLLESMRELYPEADTALHEDLVRGYREAYAELRSARDFEQQLFPGTLEVLQALRERDVLLGIATGKSRRGLRNTLDLHGIRGIFATLQTADDAPSKPHPGMVLRAMEETGSEPSQTIFVGDTVFDMHAARNARATGIGVSWGYHPAEELRGAGAALVIQDYGELLRWLDGFGA